MIRLCLSFVEALSQIGKELRDIATLQELRGISQRTLWELAVDLLLIIAGCAVLTIVVYSF